MTIVTSVATCNVRRMFSSRRITVVTGTAISKNLGVINVEHGRPDIRRVAALANIGRLNMKRPLSCCLDTVVTAGTVSGDIQVIEICGQPTGGTVAIITRNRALNMRRVFTSSSHSIVTACTSSNDLRVINGHDRCP